MLLYVAERRDFMTFEEIMNEQRTDKEIVDNLKISYLDMVDLEVCNYVSSQLEKIDFLNSSLNVGRQISLDELIDNSIYDMSLFGDEAQSDAFNIINRAEIYRVPEDFGFGTYLRYERDFNGDIPIFGDAKGFNIPEKLYEISSALFSHELVHALKDTIYYEYVYNKTLGEVIPLFYELISNENNMLLKGEVLKLRLCYLMDNNAEYKYFSDLINDNILKYYSTLRMKTLEDIELYNFIRSRVGCYLNSYYYAIMLYRLYKENPRDVLGYVSMVLNKEMTTFQLLSYLGIYGDIRGEIFEKEISNIKKLVK